MGEPEECRGCMKTKEKSCIMADIESAIHQGKEIPICPNFSDLVTSQPNQRPDNGAQVTAIENDIMHKRQILKNEGIKYGAQVHQSGALSGKTPSKLTSSEKEILHLISEEFLTPKQIATCRKSKIRVVYKHIASLKKKGLINATYQRVHKSQSTCASSAESNPVQPPARGGAVHKNQIRLHGQEINAGILFKDDRYKNKVGQTIFIDGNTVRCYRNSIEVYSGQSFFADDVQKATAQSMEYWTRFFVRLENDLKVIIVKPRAQNIKLVNQHYAEVGNELATECEMKGDEIRIYANDDGKLWFIIDNSFNLREAETLHPQTAKEDMAEVVKPFFNDLRDKKPPKLSEIMDIIDKTVRTNQETASGLNAAVTFLKSQLPKEPGEEQKTNQAPKEKSKTSEMGGMYQ